MLWCKGLDRLMSKLTGGTGQVVLHHLQFNHTFPNVDGAANVTVLYCTVLYCTCCRLYIVCCVRGGFLYFVVCGVL